MNTDAVVRLEVALMDAELADREARDPYDWEVHVMTDDDAAAIVERVCERHRPLGEGAARRLAAALRLEQPDGDRPITPYRCPFAWKHPGSSWHVGHAPSIEGLRAIASAIRHFSGNDPGLPRGSSLDGETTTTETTA